MGAGALTNSDAVDGATWAGGMNLASAATVDGAGNTTLSGAITGNAR